jgi:hypothetical protein
VDSGENARRCLHLGLSPPAEMSALLSLGPPPPIPTGRERLRCEPRPSAGALAFIPPHCSCWEDFGRRSPITLTRNATDASAGDFSSITQRFTTTPSATASRTLWEGTAAFENRRRTLAPEQYQILAAHTPKGMTRVILFPKDILKAEWKADAPRRDALADKRARGWAKREARMKRAVELHRSRDRRG